MGVMLLIVLSLTAIFASKIAGATNAASSVGAIYAADSALEWCLYINHGNLAVSAPTMSNGATYVITSPYTPTDDCTAIPLNHQVVGSYRGVSRSLHVEVP